MMPRGGIEPPTPASSKANLDYIITLDDCRRVPGAYTGLLLGLTC